MLGFSVIGCRGSESSDDPSTVAAANTRTFHFEYLTTVSNFPRDAQLARVWVPVPQSDEAQTISNLKVEGVVDHRISTEPVYGNRMVYVDFAAPLPERVELRLSFDVERKESRAVSGLRAEVARERLLAADYPPAIRDEVRERAFAAVARAQSVEEQARGIFDRVLADVDYDKSGHGWGRGDIEHVCGVGKGNCSDFHTLFIGMARAEKIPSVFEIGFPIPADKRRGTIDGYHCWAWYRDGDVWRPVDVSEADKAPAKADYYFGAVCENRVGLTSGRDLILSPPQQGAPISFFIYPYVEIDGRAVDSKSISPRVDKTLRFADAS
jgi:transglutaminase-like putative cysteine protease